MLMEELIYEPIPSSNTFEFPTDLGYCVTTSFSDSNLEKKSKILCANKKQIQDLVNLSPQMEHLVDFLMPGSLVISLPYHQDETTILEIQIPNHQVALDVLDMMGPLICVHHTDDYLKPTIIEERGGAIYVVKEGSISTEMIKQTLKYQ